MSQETAELILYAMTTLLAFVWFSGLIFVLRSGRPVRGAASEERVGPRLDEPGWVEGEVEVPGDPEAVADAAVKALASGSAAGLGPVKILERRGGEILFEGAGWEGANAPALGRARLRFLPARTGGRTAVAFAGLSGSRGLLVASWVLLALGLVAIAVGFALIRALVVSSEDLAVRRQVFQMLQAGHFVWPPFLFAGLHRGRRRALARRLEAFASNLAFIQDGGGRAGGKWGQTQD